MGAAGLQRLCPATATAWGCPQAPQRAWEERGPAGKKIPLSLSRNFLFLPGPRLQEPIKLRCTAGNYRLPEAQGWEAGYAGGGWGAAGRQEPSCQPGCQGGKVHTRCPINLPRSRQRLRAFWVGHDITRSQSGARQPFFLLRGLSLWWWRHILWRGDAWTQCVSQPVAVPLIFQAEPANP